MKVLSTTGDILDASRRENVREIGLYEGLEPVHQQIVESPANNYSRKKRIIAGHQPYNSSVGDYNALFK